MNPWCDNYYLLLLLLLGTIITISYTYIINNTNTPAIISPISRGWSVSVLYFINRNVRRNYVFYAPPEGERAGYKDEQRLRHTVVEQCQWRRTRLKDRVRTLHTLTQYYYYIYIYIPNTLKRQTARILPPSF